MSECKHGYTSVFGSHALICPYCEIDRLKGEVKELKRDLSAIEDCSDQTLQQLFAKEDAYDKLFDTADRYRQALERILITEGSSQVYIVKQIAREALEVDDGRT